LTTGDFILTPSALIHPYEQMLQPRGRFTMSSQTAATKANWLFTSQIDKAED
jgi:hypothetical protein